MDNARLHVAFCCTHIWHAKYTILLFNQCTAQQHKVIKQILHSPSLSLSFLLYVGLVLTEQKNSGCPTRDLLLNSTACFGGNHPEFQMGSNYKHPESHDNYHSNG